MRSGRRADGANMRVGPGAARALRLKFHAQVARVPALRAYAAEVAGQVVAALLTAAVLAPAEPPVESRRRQQCERRGAGPVREGQHLVRGRGEAAVVA